MTNQGVLSLLPVPLIVRNTGAGAIQADDAVARIILMSFTVGCALKPLGLAVKLHPLDENKVSWKLYPWIVEAALARLGSRQLSVEEQRTVLQATRTSVKVSWPSWWSVFE